MDISYLLLLQNLREATGGVMDGFFQAASDFVLNGWTYMIMAVLYWCVAKKAAAWIMMNETVGSSINNTVKLTACVYRPWIRDSRIIPAGDAISTATGYSFPSGHSQKSVAFFGTIAVWQRRRKWLAVLCIIAVAIVMFSRNYLGVHTPQDVIVGCALCCLVIFVNSRILHWIGENNNRDIFVMMIVLILGTAALIYFALKPYPLDYTSAGELIVDPIRMQPDAYEAVGQMFGFWVGFVMERHFVKFDVDGSVPGCIVRGAVGLVLLDGIDRLKAPITALMGTLPGGLASQFLKFFFILFLYPLLFKFVESLLKKKSM